MIVTSLQSYGIVLVLSMWVNNGCKSEAHQSMLSFNSPKGINSGPGALPLLLSLPVRDLTSVTVTGGQSGRSERASLVRVCEEWCESEYRLQNSLQNSLQKFGCDLYEVYSTSPKKAPRPLKFQNQKPITCWLQPANYICLCQIPGDSHKNPQSFYKRRVLSLLETVFILPIFFKL